MERSRLTKDEEGGEEGRKKTEGGEEEEGEELATTILEVRYVCIEGSILFDGVKLRMPASDERGSEVVVIQNRAFGLTVDLETDDVELGQPPQIGIGRPIDVVELVGQDADRVNAFAVVDEVFE